MNPPATPSGTECLDAQVAPENGRPPPGRSGAISAKAPQAKSSAAFATLDANEAVARIAYALSEVIAIYPITPATPMGEWTDQWSAEGQRNLWGTVPAVGEMQSAGGAAGGALWGLHRQQRR